MKKIFLISIILIISLSSIFYIIKYKHETKIKDFINLTYSSNLKFEKIDCFNFYKEECSINNISYIINENEIIIKQITINNIYDIKDILNKSLNKEEIKHINILVNNISINSKDIEINNYFNNYKNNLLIDITMINNNDNLYSQTKIDMNLGIFNIKNKLNLTEIDNVSIINDNQFLFSFNNKDLFNLLYEEYINNYNISKNKLEYNKKYYINSEELIEKKVFINLIKNYKTVLLTELNNPFLSFFNKNNQLSNKLNKLFLNEKEDFYINFINVDKIETSKLLESFNYFMLNKKLPTELKNVDINIK
jgi:hypothetical protein